MNKNFKRVIDGKKLNESEMTEAMNFIMDGWASNEDLLPFLTAMTERGPTVDEIVGAARVLRERSLKIKSPYGTVDCCGTGGDAPGTYNISTAVALVAAGCGVPVAKHGNRASSSRSGAADVLETIGVNLEMSPPMLEQALEKLHFCFLMAPKHHAAMKHVAVARKKLGKPTIFNLLGPLANPAGATLQLLGVYDRQWLRPMAEALLRLGTRRAWVVHGADGLDEISMTGPTYVAILDEEQITEKVVTPADFGMRPTTMEKLKGGDPSENAAALRALLDGQKTAYRDIVLANTSAVLNIHGSAETFDEGISKAAESIDKGYARLVLRDYIGFSRDNEQPAA